MNATLATFDSIDLKKIAAAVGPGLQVQYNKPHCYPMAAPTFVQRPRIERPHPLDPYSIYVHIPFCNYRCSFCTYATRQGAKREQMERYVGALQREFEWVKTGTSITELYVGGGTPTTLPAGMLNDVLRAVTAPVNFLPDAIRTVECSPESLTEGHVDVLRRHAINRVSMGVQTLDNEVLAHLNRRHSEHDALTAMESLVAAGLLVNIDLIYGLPGQTTESVARDFRAIASTGVHSVTVYNLRINERTPVAGALQTEEQLDLERLIQWRAAIHAIAAELGFTQTRWHTFVRQSPQCAIHQLGPGIADTRNSSAEFGIGQSARSRLGASVYRNHVEFHTYLQRIEAGESPVEEVFELCLEERKTLFIGKSLGDGKPLNRDLYQATFGCSFEQDYGLVLTRLAAGGLIHETPTEVSLTPTGKLVFDLVTWRFYPQHAQDWIADRQGVKLPSTKPRPVPVAPVRSASCEV